MENHDHGGPWLLITAVAVLLGAWTSAMMMLHAHQFAVIYDRVAEIQREMECEPPEVFLTDQDGNEFCVEPKED